MSQLTDTNTAASRVIAREIRMSHAGRRVLDGVDLDVRPGELVSVLGPSGSGKSTLLRIVAGLQKPSSGDVRIDGAPLDGPRPDVALAFQDPCLLPWLSVEANVAFGLGFARQPKLARGERRERVAAALNAVGLGHARHYTPRQLSGGMAQRAALARCLARGRRGRSRKRRRLSPRTPAGRSTCPAPRAWHPRRAQRHRPARPLLPGSHTGHRSAAGVVPALRAAKCHLRCRI